MTLTDIALQNLISPMVLFFVVGLLAAVAKSDLTVPEAVAKFLSLYLLMSIGFRGGAEVAHHGVTGQLLGSLAAGVAVSFAIPIVAYQILTRASRLSPIDAASVLADGSKIDGVSGLRKLLLDRHDEFIATVSAKMLTYALGRGLEYYDMPAVRSIAREAGRNDFRWSSLILGIVRSPTFQMRRSES